MMKKLRMMSYSLIVGLVFGCVVPVVQAGEIYVDRSEQKSRIKKVISSKWFKLGVVAAGMVALGGGLIECLVRRRNKKIKNILFDASKGPFQEACGEGSPVGTKQSNSEKQEEYQIAASKSCFYVLNGVDYGYPLLRGQSYYMWIDNDNRFYFTTMKNLPIFVKRVEQVSF